ncbi:MAG: molybdenum ABC transporter ATP-binding protein [Alphaproteobacteria bacterium]
MNGADAIGAVSFRGTVGTFPLEVAFTFPMQGVTALFGPSGCGKTTILRCMAGLHHLPGRFEIGRDIWQDSDRHIFRAPHRRPVGYVLQEASLFPHLSVQGNLRFGLRRSELRESDHALRFDDIVQLLGIGHLLRRDANTLSGGERQRVAIGRALLSQPRILLMDEPLSALDSMTKDEILPYLETLHRTLRIPMVYVSHDIAEVARLADRIVVLSNGRKLAEGPITKVWERLDLQSAIDRADAGVILEVHVLRHDTAFRLTYLDHHGQELAIPMVDRAPGETLRIRILARDVSLATERPSGISIRNILLGTIREIVEESETAHAEVLVDLGDAILRSSVTRASVAELKLVPGRSVFAMVKSIAFDRLSLNPGPNRPD